MEIGHFQTLTALVTPQLLPHPFPRHGTFSCAPIPAYQVER